jgi:hypothetical protein
VNLSGERFATLKQCKDPLTQAMLNNYRVWARKKNLAELSASTTLFDTVAVYLANPGPKPLLKLELLPISVNKKGITQIDPKGHKMWVATYWNDLDGYRDLLMKIYTGR